MTPPDEAGRRRGFVARLRAGRSGPRSPLQRRVFVGARLVAALALVGGLYAGLTPHASAEDTPTVSGAAAEGKALYDRSCITCHGENAQGVPDRGPSLIGLGSAAVEFQVTTGRMPAALQGAQAERKPPVFTDDQARMLGAYIQALGGGPQVPPGDNLHSEGDIAKGGDLFRVNCAACHSFGTGGGALSSGKSAPGLGESTDRQMYAAMLTGPQN